LIASRKEEVVRRGGQLDYHCDPSWRRGRDWELMTNAKLDIDRKYLLKIVKMMTQ
jgi:hypothetical protein